MRWQKGEDWVEIASANSVDQEGAAVWHIESSFGLKDLPVQFRGQVLKTDEEGYKELKNAVSEWAARKGYDLISSNTT